MLVCPECNKKYKRFQYACSVCGSVLFFRPVRPSWKPRGKGVWRYKNLLPVKKKIISLGEGNTPLIKRRDKPHLDIWMKLEGDNPTGSFKDRGTTVVTSHAKSSGYRTIGTASTGNMGASVAAYAAYANIKAKVFVPVKIPKGKIAQIIAYGAELTEVRGTFHDCVDELLEDVVKNKTYLAMSGLNPYYLEGEKTIAFELYEQLKTVPDKIIVPMGTGGMLTAIYKGFKELKQMKKTRKLPKMIGVQARACAPIYNAWKHNRSEIALVKKAKTIASAIMVKTPFNGHTAIDAINKSKGRAIAVSETQILRAIRELGKEGVFAEPAAATSIAALRKMRPREDQKIVLIVSGSGLKQPLAVLKG